MSTELRQGVLREIGRVVVDRDREAELLLVSFLAEGHALIEGVPGVSKTLLARSFSRCFGLEFGRVQFTPDMLPLDILGGFVFDVKERQFEFRKGPVFTNILLADEINRAPPKVQSALLEAMQEKQVTIEGHTEKLPSPHMVIATQNPIEFQGVYPLPEGQVDRIMMRIPLGYPNPSVEATVIRRNLAGLDADQVKQVVPRDQLDRVLAAVREVKASDEILHYLSSIGEATRTDERISLGASPRAVVHLAEAARALAYVRGRQYVTPDDVKELAPYVLTHRIRISSLATASDGRDLMAPVLQEIIDKVEPPR